MTVAASRYAKALIDVLYPNKAEAGLEQLQRFSSLLTTQPDSRRVFENPTISSDRRKALLNQISSTLAFEPAIRNFLNLLIDRNRIDIVDEITQVYQKLLDDRFGIVRARVTSALPMDAAQQSDIAEKLQRVTGKKVRVESATDPSLIGGVVAEVGSTIYDGSIRQQLQSFRKTLGID